MKCQFSVSNYYLYIDIFVLSVPLMWQINFIFAHTALFSHYVVISTKETYKM